MRKISEISRLTGVTVRALRYYDTIGLLKPTAVTAAGYRLYDEDALKRLGEILLFKELEFGLSEIKTILTAPNYDRNEVLTRQIKLLTVKKQRLAGVISFAEQIRKEGVHSLDFTVFNQETAERYSAEAKERWGDTDAYREFLAKTADDSAEKQQYQAGALMDLFREFGAMKEKNTDDPAVQAQVKRLQTFITDHYYTCTKPILAGLGQLYAAGGEMTDNIDAAGGPGTADFAAKAIAVYVKA